MDKHWKIVTLLLERVNILGEWKILTIGSRTRSAAELSVRADLLRN